MSKEFFYTILSSRLGLRFAPIGHTVLNVGVEEGGKAIMERIGSNNAENKQCLKIDFADPESLDGASYLGDLLQFYARAIKTLLQKWNGKATLVSLGGDHSTAYVSLSSVLEKYGSDNVCVIMFDSHADLHLPETSPSGNFHGMWLRPFTDGFYKYGLGNKKLRPSQLRFVGNLLLEDEEKRFIDTNQIVVYPSSNISKTTISELFEWTRKYAHLHISFDIDVFAESLVSATGTPNPNGFSEKDIFAILEILKNHSSISLDIVEYNPKKIGSKESLDLIEKVYSKIV